MPADPQQPRYPDVQVQLSSEDGNAFAILGRTAQALRRAGVPQEEIDDYFAEATSGDYDHLLMVAAEYRALAAHNVQVRSLTAAWMIGMGARYPNESTGSNAHTKLSRRRSP